MALPSKYFPSIICGFPRDAAVNEMSSPFIEYSELTKNLPKSTSNLNAYELINSGNPVVSKMLSGSNSSIGAVNSSFLPT